MSIPIEPSGFSDFGVICPKFAKYHAIHKYANEDADLMNSGLNQNEPRTMSHRRATNTA